MHVSKVAVKNFRLLSDVELFLEQTTTVIVGRNNCGKTSLTELFRRLLSEKSPIFRIEDFCLKCHEAFWTAFKLKRDGADAAAVRAACPVIEVKITISYDAAAPTLGPLGEFVIDLDVACTEAIALFRYELAEAGVESLFKDISIDAAIPQEKQKSSLCRALRGRVESAYSGSVFAVDPNDASNIKSAAYPRLRALLQSGFIPAQRALDDITHKESDVLGKILESLFAAASSGFALPGDKTVADNLKKAVDGLQAGIEGDFKTQLDSLLDAFELFGYPGINDSKPQTETLIDVTRLLTDHTKIRYPGLNGVNLPESYNGLGARNLIFILLKLLELFKAYTASDALPGVHLVFIEEPEVHLHPQMQEIFVAKLSEIASEFSKKHDNRPWPVQFIVTTHSSHLANRAPFDSMRYFMSARDAAGMPVRTTSIKNVRRGLGGTSDKNIEFLH